MNFQPVILCSVCFGNPSSLATQGLKAGIFFLIGVVALVLFAIACTAFSWARREKLYQK